ncbi:MAG: response regulator transcription factor [Polyangiaceae bacterium]
MVRVLLADDQTLFREGLRTVLTMKGVDVVGEAPNGAEAVKLAEALSPDVVLMDLRMPVLDGVSATRAIAALPRAPRVLVLTTFGDDESIFEALRAGALGFLLKDAPSDKLLEAIELAARGQSFLPPDIAARVVSEFARMSARTPTNGDGRKRAAELGLSERELSVLRGLASGASNKEIAARLDITEGTVKNHVTNVFAKLGVTDRTQAALRAKELGIDL